jgi:hypothetical protein
VPGFVGPAFIQEQKDAKHCQARQVDLACDELDLELLSLVR